MVIAMLLPDDRRPAAASLTDVLLVSNELILRIHLHHIKDYSHDGITVRNIIAASLGPVSLEGCVLSLPLFICSGSDFKRVLYLGSCFWFAFLCPKQLWSSRQRQIRNERSRLAEFREAQRSTTQLAYRCYGNSKPNGGGWMEERNERKYGKVMMAGMAAGRQEVGGAQVLNGWIGWPCRVKLRVTKESLEMEWRG